MVKVSYEMTCDQCWRYLENEFQLIAAFGDLASLLHWAEEYGWLLEWQPGVEDEEPARCLCPACAKQVSDAHSAAREAGQGE